MFKDALISKCGVLKIWWEDKVDEAREEYRGLSDMELTQLLDDEEVEPIEHAQRPDPQAEQQKRAALSQLQQQFEQATQAAQQGNQQAAQALQQIQAQAQQLQAQPPVMVHDVTVKRTRKAAQVRIDPVPPEEFFISRKGKRISEAPFVAHVVERSVSDLRAEGYEIADDELPSDDAGMVGRSSERAQRWSYDDSTTPYPNLMETNSDPSMRTVWVVEAYLRADVDGDGIAEWRRLLKVGSTILDNVECDGPPFVSVTPVPMPHRFFGLSIADMAMPAQKQKTAMQRAIEDNIYNQVNERCFAVEGQVNLDDLLTSRPGGVVRIKSPGAVGPLNQGRGSMSDAYHYLEYVELQKENRTGWSRQSAGPGENLIDKTATEVATTTNRADMRTELIARIFAETGVKDLFVQILKLVCQYQDQSAQFQLNGRWLEVNPREWRHQFDVVVNVGLGSNDPHQKMGQISMLMQTQERLAQAGTGIVTPAEAYNSACEMVKALGYKDADRFLKNPKDGPPPAPPEPPPDPRVQIEQMRIEDGRSRFQAEQQAEQQRVQNAMLAEQHKQEMQAQENQHQQQLEAERELQRQALAAQAEERKHQMDAYQAEQRLAFERWKAELDASVRISVAEIAAKTTMDKAMLAATQAANTEVSETLGDDEKGGKESGTQTALAMALQGFGEALNGMRAPRQIVRDADGKVQGII